MANPNENSGEERTETPSTFRREEFRKKGQVAVSRELQSVVLLLSGGLCLFLVLSMMFREFAALTSQFFQFGAISTFGKEQLLKMGVDVFQSVGWMMSPVFGVAFVVGVLVCVAQVGFHITWEPLSPKFERLNPVNGFKRIFSWKGSVEGIKAVLKLIITLGILGLFLPAD